MVIHKFNSFRRYTPPTCTLEIYHPQPFWGRWRSQSFPPLFSFQLHFDDPRLAKDSKISIIGDRDLLEKLRIKVEEYINQYLENPSLTSTNASSEIPVKDSDKIIHFSRQSDHNHLLYYQSFEPHPETIEVVLNNTQLFDLVNALEAYHQDATKVISKPIKRPISIGTGIALTAMVGTVSGFFWWRYQENIATTTVEDNPQSSIDKYQKNIQAVIPPSLIDSEAIPKIIVPKIPPELLNQKALVPPTPVSPDIVTDLPLSNRTKTKTTKNFLAINFESSPSSKSSNQNDPQISHQDNSIMKTINPDFVAYHQPDKLNKETQDLPSSLPSLPKLSSSNLQQNPDTVTQINDNVSINNSDNKINLQQNFDSSNPSILAKQVRQDISGEVKEYFQDKWQPPENLKQSIEYRLQVSENGALTKITPVGQLASVFLEQVPIASTDEIITSSFTQISSATIRLILSPNGGVQTFAE